MVAILPIMDTEDTAATTHPIHMGTHTAMAATATAAITGRRCVL